PISFLFFFFSSRRRHTRFSRDWSSDVCSSDLHRCRCTSGPHPLDEGGKQRKRGDLVGSSTNDGTDPSAPRPLPRAGAPNPGRRQIRRATSLSGKAGASEAALPPGAGNSSPPSGRRHHAAGPRSEEHTSELQSRENLV